MSIIRVWTIAANVFREVIRDRILYIIGIYAAILLVVLRLLPWIAAAQEAKIVTDFGLAALQILGILVAILVGTGLVNKEIDKRTVLVLLPKPVGKFEFILGKHLGLSGVLAVLVAAMAVVYFGLLRFHGVNPPIVSVSVAIVYLFLQMLLITAVAILWGVFTSSLLAMFLSFTVYISGSYTKDLVELGKISQNSTFQWLTQILYVTLPDLSRLDLKNDAVYGILPNNLGANALYGLVYTLFLILLATVVFDRRQF